MRKDSLLLLLFFSLPFIPISNFHLHLSSKTDSSGLSNMLRRNVEHSIEVTIAKKPPLHGKPLKETGILATSKKYLIDIWRLHSKENEECGIIKTYINQRDSGDTEPHTCDKAWIMANLKLVYLWFLQIMFRILDFFLSYLFPNHQKFSALPTLSIRFIFYHPFIHLYKT